MDEEGKVGGVSKEEDRGVIVNPIPVSFLSVELDSKTCS